MNNEELEAWTKDVKKTLGKEKFAAVSPQIGTLITANEKTQGELADKDKEIAELKERNEQLIASNQALFQQIPMATEKKSEPEKEEKNINFRDCFDEFGNFKQ